MKPRFVDSDVDGLERRIATLTHELTRYPEVSDPRNFQPFLDRARARFVRGYAAIDVANDLRCAAICRRGQAELMFHRLPPNKLKTRRLDPMHLALHHADPELVEAVGAAFGLPLITVYADAADPAVEMEARQLSSYFRHKTFDHPVDVAGFAAASYAAALGALMRGDDSEAATVLRLLSEGTAELQSEPVAAARRYLLLCAALADLLGNRREEFGRHIEAIARATPCTAESAPELSVPALVGLARLLNMPVDLENLGAAMPDAVELARVVKATWDEVE